MTGDDGRATVVIPLPDRVAAWRLLAQGVTVDTLAGDASVEFVATKDLYGQLKLPSAFTDGDEADVVALVHNRLPAEQTVEVTLATQIGSRRAEERKTVKVAAASVAEVPFHVQLDLAEFDAGAKPQSDAASEAVFQLDLTAGQRRDVLRRAVPIQPYGMPVSVASGGVADANTAAWVEPPATMPLLSPRLQIVVGATVERSLLDAVLGEPAPACVSPVETAASDLMAALALQQLFGAAPVADGPVARQLDTRIRAALGTLIGAQREKDGGWSWSARADTADRFVTARVLWALGLAGKAGYPVPHEVREKALRCLADQWAALSDDDYESKAMLLYARCVAGERDFEPANGLYRVRPSLSTPALLYLALALLEMERPETAAELLDLVAKRKLDDAEPGRPRRAVERLTGRTQVAVRAGPVVGAAARTQNARTDRLAPGSPHRSTLVARQSHRSGDAGPVPMVRPTALAGRAIPTGRLGQQPAGEGSGAGCLGTQPGVRRAGRTAGAGQTASAVRTHGRGRYAYQVLLSGFVPADQLKSTTAACRVERFYSPAPLERDGQPVPRGFDFLKRNLLPFRNELHQLPVGRLGEVELRIVRDAAPWVPAEQLEYLVVREPLPGRDGSRRVVDPRRVRVVRARAGGDHLLRRQSPQDRQPVLRLAGLLAGHLPRRAHHRAQCPPPGPNRRRAAAHADRPAAGGREHGPVPFDPAGTLGLGPAGVPAAPVAGSQLAADRVADGMGIVGRRLPGHRHDAVGCPVGAEQRGPDREVLRDHPRQIPRRENPVRQTAARRCCLSSDRRARAEFPGLPGRRRELVHVRDGRAGVPGGPRRIPAERGCDGAICCASIRPSRTPRRPGSGWPSNWRPKPRKRPTIRNSRPPASAARSC